MPSGRSRPLRMAGTAGTPRDILRRLNEETVKAVQSPEMRDRLHAEGSEVRFSTIEEFEKLIAVELKRWNKVIKQAGITEVQ